MDFETRIVRINLIQLTEYDALPMFFEGSLTENILPFGNYESPIFISFVYYF